MSSSMWFSFGINNHATASKRPVTAKTCSMAFHSKLRPSKENPRRPTYRPSWGRTSSVFDLIPSRDREWGDRNGVYWSQTVLICCPSHHERPRWPRWPHDQTQKCFLRYDECLSVLCKDSIQEQRTKDGTTSYRHTMIRLVRNGTSGPSSVLRI